VEVLYASNNNTSTDFLLVMSTKWAVVVEMVVEVFPDNFI
jgi:hypothetical protein